MTGITISFHVDLMKGQTTVNLIVDGTNHMSIVYNDGTTGYILSLISNTES